MCNFNSFFSNTINLDPIPTMVLKKNLPGSIAPYVNFFRNAFPVTVVDFSYIKNFQKLIKIICCQSKVNSFVGDHSISFIKFAG